MELRELATRDGLAVAHAGQDVAKGAINPMRRLEEDDGPMGSSQLVKPLLTVFRPSWRESEEGEGLRRKSRRSHRRHHRAWAWDGLDPDSRFDGQSHELSSWIR